MISLESRRAELMEQLIRRCGGDAFVAPSVQEIPFSKNEDVFAWAERLFAGDFDMMVLMTGVGLTYLRDALVQRVWGGETHITELPEGRRILRLDPGERPLAVDLFEPEVGIVVGRCERRPRVWAGHG